MVLRILIILVLDQRLRGGRMRQELLWLWLLLTLRRHRSPCEGARGKGAGQHPPVLQGLRRQLPLLL